MARPFDVSPADLHPSLGHLVIKHPALRLILRNRAVTAWLLFPAKRFVTSFPAAQKRKCLPYFVIKVYDSVLIIYNINSGIFFV